MRGGGGVSRGEGGDSQREGNLVPSGVPSSSSDAKSPPRELHQSWLIRFLLVPEVNPLQLKGHRTQVRNENSWIAVVGLHSMWGFIFNSLKL